MLDLEGKNLTDVKGLEKLTKLRCLKLGHNRLNRFFLAPFFHFKDNL